MYVHVALPACQVARPNRLLKSLDPCACVRRGGGIRTVGSESARSLIALLKCVLRLVTVVTCTNWGSTAVNREVQSDPSRSRVQWPAGRRPNRRSIVAKHRARSRTDEWKRWWNAHVCRDDRMPTRMPLAAAQKKVYVGANLGRKGPSSHPRTAVDVEYDIWTGRSPD